MIMLGPSDFSILSGIPGQFDHPKVAAALKTIAAAAPTMASIGPAPSALWRRRAKRLKWAAVWFCMARISSWSGTGSRRFCNSSSNWA